MTSALLKLLATARAALLRLTAVAVMGAGAMLANPGEAKAACEYSNPGFNSFFASKTTYRAQDNIQLYLSGAYSTGSADGAGCVGRTFTITVDVINPEKKVVDTLNCEFNTIGRGGAYWPGPSSFTIRDGFSCSVAYDIPAAPASSYNFTATFALGAGVPATISRNMNLAREQTTPVTIQGLPARLTVGDLVDVTVSGGDGQGDLALSSDTPSVCSVGNVDIGAGKFSVTAAGQGTCTVKAFRRADSTYAESAATSASVTVVPAVRIVQVISWDQELSGKVGDPPITLTATASSGLAVSYSSRDTTICEVVDGRLELLAVGPCDIDAAQGGDAAYAPTTFLRSFMVGRGTQPALSFTSAEYEITYGETFDFAGEVTGGDPAARLNFRVLFGNCSSNGSIVTPLSGNTQCIVQATAISPNHEDVSATTKLFVKRKDQGVLTITQNPAGNVFVGQSKTVTVSGGNAGAYELTSGSAACAVTRNGDASFTVEAKSSGTCSLTAKPTGDATYSPLEKTASFETASAADACTVRADSLGIVAEPLYRFDDGQPASPIPVKITGTATFTRLSGFAEACDGMTVPYAILTGANQTFDCKVRAPQPPDFGNGDSVSFTFTGANPVCTFDITPVAATLPLVVKSGTVENATTLKAWVKPSDLVVVIEATDLVLGEMAVFLFGGGEGNRKTPVVTAIGGCEIAGSITKTSGAVRATAASGTCAVKVSLADDPDLGGTSYLGVSGTSAPVPLKASAGTISIRANPAFYVNDIYSLSVSGGAGTGLYQLSVVPNPGESQPRCSVSFDGTSGTGMVTGLRGGNCKLEARKLGDSKTRPAGPAFTNIEIMRIGQEISWDQELSGKVGDPPITLTATASSGFAVSYSSRDTTICKVVDGTLELLAIGSCDIDAAQGGDAAYAPTTFSRSFMIDRGTQPALSFNSAGYEITYGETFDFAREVTGGDPAARLYFRVLNGNCSSDGSIVTPASGNTSCIVQATAISPNHWDVSATTELFVNGKEQGVLTLSLGSTSLSFGEETDITVSGGSSSSDVVFEVTGPCDAAVGKLKAGAGSGTCSVTAVKPRDAFYAEVRSNTVTVTLGLAAQQVFLDLPSEIKVGESIDLNGFFGTDGRGTGAVFFTAEGSGCSLAGSMLTGAHAGQQCSVTLTKAADALYAEAQSSDSTAIVQGDQTGLSVEQEPAGAIKVGTVKNVRIYGGNGNGAYSLAAQSDACKVVDAEPVSGVFAIQAMKLGTCELEAGKAGDANYPAAAPVQSSFAMEQGDQPSFKVSASGPLSFPGSVKLLLEGGTPRGKLSFAVTGGPCELKGDDELVSTGIGTCTVVAQVAGGGDFADVTSEPLSIIVNGSQLASLAEKTVRNSLGNNANVMTGFRPTTGRLSQGRSTGGTAGALAPSGTSAQGMVAFSTSARQLVQAAGKSDLEAADGAEVVPTAVTRPDEAYNPLPRRAGTFDIWIDGRFAWANGADGEGGLDSRVFLGETGVDYLISENLLVGLSLRLDTNDADLGGDGGSLETLGWMVGPYAVVELARGVQFDAKLAYGQSGNDITVETGGANFDGSYDTTRWLAEAGLRGNWDLAPVVIEPGLRGTFYTETADEFRLDGKGGTVGEQELTLLRLALDPRISYSTTSAEGTAFNPFFSPQLVAEWQDLTDEDGAWDVYGVVEGGLSIATEDYALSGSLSASGLGGDGDMIYSAGANLTIPLN